MTGHDPPEVHRDVHDELLQLLVGELAGAQRRLEVLGGLVVHPELGAATDAHEPPVATGEVLVARPHLAVEEVEVRAAPERRRRGRGGDAVHRGVGVLATDAADVVVDRICPGDELRELHLLAAFLGDLGHRGEDVRVYRRTFRPTHLGAEEQQELVDLLVGDVTTVQSRVGVGLHGDGCIGGAHARQGDPATVTGREDTAAPHLAEHEPDDPGVDVRADGRRCGRGHDVLVLRLGRRLAVVAVGELAHWCLLQFTSGAGSSGARGRECPWRDPTTPGRSAPMRWRRRAGRARRRRARGSRRRGCRRAARGCWHRRSPT